jgi:hypothetical protein
MVNLARRPFFSFVLLLLVLHAVPALAQPKTADDVILESKNWSELYRAYQLYGKESDGVVAGAFTDTVSSLLAERWELLDELRQLGTKDKKFMKFIMSNINQAVPSNRATKIRDKATSQCGAKENKALCRKIVRAIDQTAK